MTDKSNLAYISEPCPSTDGIEYDEALRLAVLEVRKLLKTTPPLIRVQTSHLARAAGKGIRARALLACSMCSDGLVRRDAVNAAAAVELLHLATLIHDDIIDDAE